ncbi:MAG: glycosyltransferase [Pedosphaera parvula]|nr:glycosyltransferase [Pedosphaera parvula]
MYCGNCFRDNALVAELRELGHSTLMIPLYLPMTLDEEDSSSGTPIFYGGINVYLEQKVALFRKSPRWLHHLFDAPGLLQWAAGRAAKTRAEDVGDLTVSMLKGEEGNQARELEELIAWLKEQEKPDVICLSNAMLIGLARRLQADLGAPVVCMLQGEDCFLDALPEAQRALAWQTLAERAAELKLFIAPTRYFADLMGKRLGIPPDRIQIVPNGIRLDGFSPATTQVDPPVLGYFARMCPEKGLDTLVEAFLLLKARNPVENLKLRVGGGCGPGDEAFVRELRERLQKRGWLPDAEFHPNLTREDKIEFLRSLSVLSVPARCGEAFGLYLVEAWASGVPVAQPRTASFPELIKATNGGVLCEPGDPAALAHAIEQVLIDRKKARALGENGRQAVLQHFSVERMAENMLKAFQSVTG